MLSEAMKLFNNATHMLRNDFNDHADALIQWHRDQIDKLIQAKADVRRATDPVCGLPELMPEDDEGVEQMAQRLIAGSRGDTDDNEREAA